MVNPYNQRETLIDDNYLDNQIKTPGSKFNPEQKLLSDPLVIYNIVTNYLSEMADLKQFPCVKNGKKTMCTFEINFTPELKTKYGLDADKSMGFANVIKIKEEDKDKVYQKPRGQEEMDKYSINLMKVAELPATDKLIVVVAKFDDKPNYQMFGAWTGVIAPPIPNLKYQSKEEFDYNGKFWSEHVFLEIENK